MKRSFGKMAQSSKRPEIISLDDSDDDDFASPPSPSYQPSVRPGDSRALLLDAIRLIEEEREAHKKTLEKKDEENRRLKEMIGGGDNRWVAEVAQVQNSILDKMRDHLLETRKQVQQAADLSTWVVSLDDGASIILPPNAQYAVDQAVEIVWKLDPDEVVKNAFTAIHHGRSVKYDLRYDADTEHIYQMNSETKKERRVLSTILSTTCNEHMKMNYAIMRLCDEDGKFVFQEEYERVMTFPFTDKMIRWQSNSFEEIVNVFLSPFVEERCAPGRGDMWCRPSWLFHFLSMAKYKSTQDSCCFMWTHGTTSADFIRKDPLGMNVQYSKIGNAKGDGVYVACNPYVPMQWVKQNMMKNKVKNGQLVFGLALTDMSVEHYRMKLAANVKIEKEPSFWESMKLCNAVVLKNPQQSAVFPFGCITYPQL